MRNVQQVLLHFVNAIHPRLTILLLDDGPYLVADQIKVGAVGGHRSGRMKDALHAPEIVQCHMSKVQGRCPAFRSVYIEASAFPKNI